MTSMSNIKNFMLFGDLRKGLGLFLGGPQFLEVDLIDIT
jgi:hypothetical protein